MRWPGKHALSPIGLDLGSHTFKAVQVAFHAGGWELAASVSLPRATPGTPLTVAEIARLEGVLDRRGFVGRDVVVAVPAASLLTAILELPARAPGVPLAQIAEIEFGRVHKVDAASLSMSVWELPASVRASKATYMLAVGAKVDALDAHLDLVESGRLSVVAVDESFSAGARGSCQTAAATTALTAVVDLGWHATTLAILKAGVVIYTRQLGDAGLADVFRDAAESGFVDAETVRRDLWDVGFGSKPTEDAHAEVIEILATHVATTLKEIGQAIGYAGHQYPDAAMDRVLLTGGGASIPGMPERFAEALAVPTHPAGAAGGVPAAMMPALGLALARREAA